MVPQIRLYTIKMEARKVISETITRPTRIHLSQGVKYLGFVCISLLLLHCKPETIEKSFNHFGNVYRIDSIANQKGFADPFFVVLTKDSLFSAFGYWDYSYPYEAELKVDSSLRVLSEGKEKYKIEQTDKGLWLNFPDGKKHLYSLVPGHYDSAYKHLRVMKMQEALLIGSWQFIDEKSISQDKSAGKDILRCKLDESSLLRFTRRNDHKIVQVESIINSKIDTCLRRDFRLNGNAVLIFEYDGFPPWTILNLDKQNLVLQGSGDILYFEKID
jgi:hypothetical protein